MIRTNMLRVWSLSMGAMDTLAGLLIVLAPETVIWLLGLKPLPETTLPFFRWIGVFVLGVGLSYGLAFRDIRSGAAAWAFTGMARMMVCAYLTTMVAAELMEAEWLLVAAADGGVALVQFAGLALGWWKEARE